MLHVLNGDATAAVFARASIPGDTLVWRDILCDVPLAAAVRALAGGDRPLVTIDGGAIATCGHWRLQLTPEGRAVTGADVY